jgi:hypothetical protein
VVNTAFTDLCRVWLIRSLANSVAVKVFMK